MAELFITKEFLFEKGACAEGINYFNSIFPDGCKLNDDTISKFTNCDTSFVWWFYENVAADTRLYTLCNVHDSINVRGSSNVHDSSNVCESSDVHDSSNVRGSSDVRGSSNVRWSSDVHDSSNVRGSSNVHDSSNVRGSSDVHDSSNVRGSSDVHDSSNVRGSSNVHDSFNVRGSNDVHDSSNVSWSSNVRDSNNVHRSFGILNCAGVSHALFLADVSSRPTVFGKEVSQEHFNSTMKQLEEKMKGWRPAYCSEAGSKLTEKEAWAGMPQAAVDFVASLPQFDPEMFERITGIYINEGSKKA